MAPKPSASRAFWRNVISFQASKITPWMALRNTVGVALPLAAGVALGAVSSGLVVSTGALNVSFSDSSDPYRQRARKMLAASLLVGLAVFAGSLSGGNHVIAVLIAAAWAFAAGMLVALGTAAADLGGISLVTLLVYTAVPLPAEKAMFAGLLALAGGLFQTLLALALWPLRPYAPERRVLGDLYTELARTAGSPAQPLEAPPASAQSLQAQSSLAVLDRDHSVEAERLRLLLSQAERMRLSLLMLARIGIRMTREDSTASAVSSLDRYFEICSRLLDAIGASLRAGEPARAVPECVQELEALAEQMREPNTAGSPLVTALKNDARFQMDALAGQLRSAVDLAAHATPQGRAVFEQREARQPWRLRLAGALATLRANFNLDSAACRHAIRLALCVGAGDALAFGFGLRRPYWLPMTVAIVLKPDFTATFSRGVLRLTGTFAGLVFATAMFHAVTPGLGAQVALIAALMFVMRCWGPANFGILVAAVTTLVVLLLGMAGVAPADVMFARGANTAAGGAIALLAWWLWPTWERTQVSDLMARMLDAYRDYFRAIRESYLRADAGLTHELDRVRTAARLARTNLEASIDRLCAEPGTSSESVHMMHAALASSHRLAHAMMALEAGLASSRPVPARDAFRPFANDVELTLYYLAAALRGSPLDREQLPDLREDHHALVHSGDSTSERYALVNVETDRIANSLNTLGEELLRWVGSGGPAARIEAVLSTEPHSDR